ncbi:hypothetical protein BCR34DRAFT_614592 [Clohesyomyces aquaticus]|uniref:Carrier domain-containing protein n=1 Tax=Clohesyomyces aquaticus TaxID=1231657 RepID=A0A1Y1ZMT7_9PLEO|nr:hypothetical protein BCR34DRAFT_614592 [Clohesyomyces aquaticus]
MLQVENLCCQPLASTTQADDKLLFSRTVWGPLLPNAEITTLREKTNQAQNHTAYQLERVSWFYFRMLESEVPREHPSRKQGPYVALFDFVSHARMRREAFGQPWWHAHWENDTMEDIKAICDQIPNGADAKLLRTLGESIVGIITGELVAIEVAMRDNVLGNYYRHGLGTADYTTYLARVVAQIAFRFPHLHCLEIGAGTGGATRAIFQEAKPSFLSYTFTDISSGFFRSAEALFKETPVLMIYKMLDVNIDPGQQGFPNHSYDVVIASLVLHTTLSLRQTLKNIRQLLKPGGYLVVLELRKDLPVRWTAMFGCFPGWWIGSEDGRRLSPCIDVEEWHVLLRECGFSGCDTVTPDTDAFARPLTVFVSQAMDEMVNFLRDPLSCLGTMHSLGFGDSPNDLVVLGGGLDEVSEFVNQLRFRRLWTTIRTARTLEELGSIPLLPTSTVLSLIELDCPIFRDMSATQWEQLKLLLQSPSSIMWVTSGRRASEPYTNMLVGVARIAKNETLGLNVQFLDIEDRGQLSNALLEAFLLRFRVSILWKNEQSDMAFAQIERELIVSSGGQVLVQRLIPDGAMNDRYNSSHRTINRLTSVRESEICLTSTQSGYILQEARTHKGKSDSGGACKRITHALLAPILVSGQNLFLGMGGEGESGQFLSLSNRHASSVTAETALIYPVQATDGRKAEFLTLSAQVCFAYENLRGLEDGDHLLVLEPFSALLKILSPISQEKGLRLTVITNQANGLRNSSVLHAWAPNRELEALDLFSVTAFMDFSKRKQNERLVARLLSIVPHWCRYASLQGSENQSATAESELRITPRLRHGLGKIANQTSEILSQSPSEDRSFNQVSLEDICDNSRDILPESIVHWSGSDEVAVQVRPIDSSNLFSPSKTYWLVGLTGSLGISLCEWMIHHGARYVVLSSRTPKVETRWQEEMTALGATLWVRSCDVTVESDVTNLHNEICTDLPPIAGVAQGAMVLKDANMRDMDYDSFSQVTLPKVQGSIHLDRLFQDYSLDFFVFFSSISSIIGIPGQSAYAAANMFMTALAERRRQQGLAASVINLGAVLGAGYISEMSLDTSITKKAMGFINLSVSDFHQLFAEAVVADGQGKSIEITAGIEPFTQHDSQQPKWASNLMMTHLMVNTANNTERSRGVTLEASLRSQLLEAESIRKVHMLVQNALCKALGNLLQLNPEMMKSLSPGTRLDELGIDSILALEIRAWLMENLHFNYPVLKLLSGITIEELVSASVDGIDAGLVPQSQISFVDASSPNVFGSVQGSTAPSERQSLTPSSGAGVTSESSSLTTLSASADHQEPDSAILTTSALSPTQTMFWSALRVFEDKTSLNFSALCSVEGRVDIDRLQGALWNLAQQHEALRTCFLNRNGILLQGIMKESTLRLEHQWIDNEVLLKEKVGRIRRHIYNAERGELVKLLLVSITPTSHFLLFGASHLCMDGISVRIFLVDLFRHYHRQPPQHPTIQFREYAGARQAEFEAGRLEHELKFWQAQYPDFPPTLPILRISRVTLRPTLKAFKSATVEARIELYTKQRVSSICRRCRVTPFHFYLTVFRVLISRFSDVDDIAIGTVDACRNDDNEGSLGVYANVLPLRFRTNATKKFEQVLQETRKIALEALSNSSAEATKVSFVHAHISMLVSNTGCDLSLDVVDDAEQDCRITLAANNDIYSTIEAKTLLEMYKKLVFEFSIRPDVATTEPNIYDQEDVIAALGFGSGSLQCLHWKGTIERRIGEIARATPDAVAVKFD